MPKHWWMVPSLPKRPRLSSRAAELPFQAEPLPCPQRRKCPRGSFLPLLLTLLFRLHLRSRRWHRRHLSDPPGPMIGCAQLPGSAWASFGYAPYPHCNPQPLNAIHSIRTERGDAAWLEWIIVERRENKALAKKESDTKNRCMFRHIHNVRFYSHIKRTKIIEQGQNLHVDTAQAAVVAGQPAEVGHGLHGLGRRDARL